MNRTYPYDEADDHTYLPLPSTRTGIGRTTLQFGCAFESRNTVKHPVSKVVADVATWPENSREVTADLLFTARIFRLPRLLRPPRPPNPRPTPPRPRH